MHGHSIAISGLDVAQKALQVIGNNLANAATEGYHKQEAIIAPVPGDPRATLQVGYGAEVTGVHRTCDMLLEAGILRQRPELGQAEQELTILESLESILSDLSGGGLAAAINDFFNALDELASEPDSPAFREQVVAAASGLAAQFRILGSSIDELADHIVHQAADFAEQINDLAGRIADSNNLIQDVRSRDARDGNLLDQRDQALSELADIAGVQTAEAQDGSYNVYVWGTLVVLQGHQTEVEVGYTDTGRLGFSVKDAMQYDASVTGGRLAGLMALYNELLPSVGDNLDTLAAEIIGRINRYHAEGTGAAGSFTELTGWAMPDDPVGEWTMPVSAGDIRLRVVDTTTGAVSCHTVSIADPSTETFATVAAALDAASPNVSASVVDGKLQLVADSGYTFDFMPVVPPDPDTGTLTGTATPTLSGVYAGATNQTLTATVVGTGEVGVTADLSIEVHDGGGNLLRTLNVGQGYAAGDPLRFADGIDIAVGHGTLNAGEQFTVEAIARSDTTGFLAAAGINTLFSGTSARTMAVTDRVLSSASCLATSLGSAGLDNLNVRRLADVGSESITDLGGDVPADAFRSVVSSLGYKVSLREARRDSLQDLLTELNRQREEISGVDVNEQAAVLLVLERMYQSMAKYLSAIDRAHQTLMELL
jgi:flagellar hook-associated protein FlgK